MNKLSRQLLLAFAILFTVNVFGQQLVVYPAPTSELDSLHNGDFTVKVRKPGGQWQDLYEYKVMVDAVRNNNHHVEDASMCAFDFSGSVEVAVTSNRGDVKTARVRPLSYNIAKEIKGNTVYFKLDRPSNLSIEINGDIFHNLHLFANPLETYRVNRNDASLIYFGPGVHEIPGGVLKIPSGKTVYLAGGAVVKGRLSVSHAHNVKILGRGIVDFHVVGGLQISNSKHVLVEGIAATQCPTGGSDSVVIRNVKVFSYYKWGDGMNIFASSDVLFDRVFCRNSDDCNTVYATRGGYTGNARNITMQNSTLWADVAHPILIGTHGNTPHPDTIENLKYINLDILDQNEGQLDYQGCMAVNVGDNNLARNILFQDIRVEDIRKGQLVNLRVFYNKKYNTSPGMGIENVNFRNITYNGTHAELSIIAGYDDQRLIKNVTFENLNINGVHIFDKMKNKPGWYQTSDMARFFVGDHVENIQFK